MKNLFLILTFGCVGLSCGNYLSGVNLVQMIAQGGGEKGFHSTSVDCNGMNRVYKMSFNGSGYEKLNVCPELMKIPIIKAIIDSFLININQASELDNAYMNGKLKVQEKIIDKGNFSLIIE